MEFDTALDRLRYCLDEACPKEFGWPDRVAASIAAALELSASTPTVMRALTIDVFDHGLSGALRYRRVVAHYSEHLAEGRAYGPSGAELPPVTEEALIGAVVGSIAEAMQTGREKSLPSRAAELAEFVLTPYLGAGEAKRVAARRVAHLAAA